MVHTNHTFAIIVKPTALLNELLPVPLTPYNNIPLVSPPNLISLVTYNPELSFSL